MLARRLVLVLAAVFLLTPAALLATGYTAKPFENRPLAPAPRLSQGWGFFDAATRYLVDRLPLRHDAVRANTWASLHVFHQTPAYGTTGVGGERAADALPFGAPQQDRAANPRPAAPQRQEVLVGKDGWEYLNDEFTFACRPPIPLAAALERWGSFLAGLRATGRRTLMVVPPDKATIYPEHLPGTVAGLGCHRELDAQLWPALAGVPAVGLRGAVLAEKRAASAPVYWQKDSHWTSVGAVAEARAIVTRLGGGRVAIAPGDVVPAAEERKTQDLSALFGTPQTAAAPAVRVSRPGAGTIVVHRVKLPSGDPTARRYTHRGATAALIPGHTVLLADSFSIEATPLLAPYFADLTVVRWFNGTPADLNAALRGADTVIVEAVEREITGYSSDPRALGGAGLEQALAGLPRR